MELEKKLQPAAGWVEGLKNRLSDETKQALACFVAAAITTTAAYGLSSRALEDSPHIEQNCDDCPPGEGFKKTKTADAAAGYLAVAQFVPPSSIEIESNPASSRSEPLKPELAGKIEKIPSLKELGKKFPGAYGDWQKQLDHIQYLLNDFEVRPQDYDQMKLNRDLVDSFADTQDFTQRIKPKLIVLHWTGAHYPDGLAGGKLFAHGLKLRGGLSSNYFIDHSGTTFSYYHEDTHKTAGALGMNDFAVNIEAEAKPAPGAPAPNALYDLTSAEVKQMTLMVVKLARRYNLAITPYTVMGHLAGDLIYASDKFNPVTGDVASLRKMDIPQELALGIIRKAQALDMQLDSQKTDKSLGLSAAP